MKSTLLLLCTAVLLIPLALRIHAQDRDDWDRETMIDERFSVSDGGTLEIAVGDADVMVEPGASDAVHVAVIVQARDIERGKDYFERQNYEVFQRGNTIRVETEPRRNIEWGWRDWRDQPHLQVRVTVPESFNADLRTSDGDIVVDRLKGDVRLKTSDGDVTAGALSGDEVTLDTSDGDIRIDALDAETIEISTSDGDLDLGRITARRVFARTSDGDIRIDALGGDAEVKTSDGDINIASFNGHRFFARTADGDITVDELIAETSTVHTSDGEITLRHVEGDLKVSGSSADIRLDLQKPGEITATTSDGDITITLPEGHRADLRLRGDDVRIASGLAFEGRLEDDRADGAINGGGTLLEARTSNGDVTLRGK